MENVSVLIESIVASQRNVVGPLALEQANAVDGLTVSDSGEVKISLKKDVTPKDLLNNLVLKYEKLFGQASIEVCKDAIKESGVKIDKSELPDILH